MIKQYNRLTDPQWTAISGFLDLKRKRKHDLRTIMDALLYIVRTGCQWRNLPSCFPKWQSVYWYFDRWKKNNMLAEINVFLNQLDRKANEKDENPSVFCIDSQSVKLSPMIFEKRGLDANKKVNGRKRQLLVDTDGRIWFAHVHAANEPDGSAALGFSADILCQNERLEKIYGDQAYNGVFARKMKEFNIKFEKASRPESAKGFVPVAKRWVIERSIAWTNFFRRIVKDYEYTVSSSVAWIILANIQLMLQRTFPTDKI
ncbi:MAG: IS5 family transposase [Dyadobacter sp. 50-39]|uniref:IS5 family transposase n=1 Tax=Dyadobacter sp. 50-39 TaxID=1895756 RepID=UPI00095D297A|nr:IS5 family transposase [Dyadobacter sp. 50-39]OJV21912.1 MAG: IS5 family transposase [Dyadobacter sp. 50-39]